MKCHICDNGKCNPNYQKCYSEDENVISGIYGCLINNNTFGNEATIDFYCGRDEFKNITHYGNVQGFHFPGCGYKPINCTEIPCCDLVKLNGDTPENCDYEVKERFVYDTIRKSIVMNITSCMDYYKDCFRINSLKGGRGQCCECEKGWGGIYCDIPLCLNCLHGTCVDKDVCVCVPEYTGFACDERKFL